MQDKPSGETGYRVLARKYRPRDFTGLIGQEPMVRTLRNAFSTGRIAQAWMLTGVRGVGKTTTARILARALNYETTEVNQPSIDLEVMGEHCAAIMEGRHVDIIEMDAASHTGIEDIKQIIDGVRYAPVSARYKVYIIDEIHMLSEKAFNALLKTLEEPPPHAKFVFATTEIRKVPITVLSRCQRFDLRRVEPDELARHLTWIAGEEGIEAEPEALATIARSGEGSVRDALSVMDQAIAHGGGAVTLTAVQDMLGMTGRDRVIDLFEAMMAGRVAEALHVFAGQYRDGGDPVAILTDLAEFTHLVTRLRFVPEAVEHDASMTPSERERGLAFSQKLPVTLLSRAWQMLLKGISEVQMAARPFAAAEMVLIRLAHAATLPALDDALRQLEEAPAGAAVSRDLSAPATASTAPGASAPRPASGGMPADAVATTGQGSGAVSAGSARGPSMQAQSPARETAPAPVAQAPEQQPEPALAGLQDLADLAEAKRDLWMRSTIRKFVRLVSIEPGKLVISPADDAPRTLAGELSQKLTEWTGRRWMVSVSAQGAGTTLEEDDRSQRDALLADAGRDPAVSAILAAFPGARVVDVRINAQSEPDLPIEETDDGDMMPPDMDSDED